MVRPSLRVIPALLLLATLPGLVQGSQAKDFSQTLDFEPGGHLRVKTFKGTVQVRPWDRSQIEIKARIEPGEDVSRDYAERSVEATRVDVWGSERSLTISSEYEDVPCRDEWWSGGCSKTLPFIHYEIRAPRKLDLSLDDHKSRLDVDGFEGRIDVDTHKGDVELANLVGNIRMSTHKGEVALADIEGRIELETHKGRIEASELTGDVRLNTHRGRVNLVGFQGSVEVETHRGDVAIRATQIEDDSRLETYRGRIDLSLPGTQGLSVRAHIGRRGDFHSDFEMTSRTFGRERIEGTINEGGPRLYVETARGEIRIKRY